MKLNTIFKRLRYATVIRYYILDIIMNINKQNYEFIGSVEELVLRI